MVAEVALLCGDGIDRVLVAAAGVLRNLACTVDNVVVIARLCAIPPLVALLRGGGIGEVKAAAIGVLWNLADNADNVAEIVRAGAVAPLVALMCAVPTLERGLVDAAALLLQHNFFLFHRERI